MPGPSEVCTVGEETGETGQIDEMLGEVAEFHDSEVEATTEQLTALLEPVMIAVLGGLVGAMAIAFSRLD